MSISVGEGEVYIEIRPTLFRRLVSLAAMIGAGALLVYLGINDATEGLIWSAFLVLAGLGFLGLAQRFHKSTAVGIELTLAELRDTTGRVLCRIDEIEKVDRGAFAMKPSNGVFRRPAARPKHRGKRRP